MRRRQFLTAVTTGGVTGIAGCTGTGGGGGDDGGDGGQSTPTPTATTNPTTETTDTTTDSTTTTTTTIANVDGKTTFSHEFMQASDRAVITYEEGPVFDATNTKELRVKIEGYYRPGVWFSADEDRQTDPVTPGAQFVIGEGGDLEKNLGRSAIINVVYQNYANDVTILYREQVES